jgi:protein-L-isoaspartate O-methyltransferase
MIYFYLYLAFSAVVCLLLLAFIITFGLPIFKGAPFAVTKPSRVKKLAELAVAAMGSPVGQQALDIGSGDGRIVIALAQAGFSATGIELNPILALWSRLKIRRARLEQKATIKRGDFWKSELKEYDLVILFGVFYIMEKLEKKLLTELKPGAIVICNHFAFPSWKPIRSEGDIYIYRK